MLNCAINIFLKHFSGFIMSIYSMFTFKQTFKRSSNMYLKHSKMKIDDTVKTLYSNFMMEHKTPGHETIKPRYFILHQSIVHQRLDSRQFRFVAGCGTDDGLNRFARVVCTLPLQYMVCHNSGMWLACF